MRIFPLFSVVILLAGCNLPMGRTEIDPTGSSTHFAVPNIIHGSCGANELQDLLDQPESALAGVVLSENSRIVRPGETFTKDADRGRLNIGIGADGTIVHVACG